MICIAGLLYTDFENVGAEVVTQPDGHVFHQTSAITEVLEMLIHDFPFLVFLFGLVLEIFKEVRLFLGAVEETELFVDDCKFTSGADTTGFEHDFLVVVKFEFVFRGADEV